MYFFFVVNRYCSNDDDKACNKMTTFVRNGIPTLGFGLEDLFLNNGVDVTIWAHQHSYERYSFVHY